MNRWYCASFSGADKNGEEIFPDCEYFEAESDSNAIDIAKAMASDGIDYVDEGHVELELLSVCVVDPENEWEETETIYF